MTPDPRVIQLVMELRSAGVHDASVLAAIERTPRERFIEAAFEGEAYRDLALPIACGQTISQPLIVALMTEALELSDRHKVLEIGTGSGYQAAVLARIARRVYTVERYRALLEAAKERFAALRLTNIVTRLADGHRGWREQAPFERIIITAAAPEVPKALFEQLAEGGVLVAPIGPEDGEQRLMQYVKALKGMKEVTLCSVRFVPLVEGVAKAL